MSKLSELLSFILSAGPRVKDAWGEVEQGITHLQMSVTHFTNAGNIIAGSAPTFGAEEATGTLTPQEQDLAAQLEAKLSEGEPLSAEERGGIFQKLVAFLAAHPELVALILSLLKK